MGVNMLLTPGYFQDTYFVADYFIDDYWQDVISDPPSFRIFEVLEESRVVSVSVSDRIYGIQFEDRILIV